MAEKECHRGEDQHFEGECPQCHQKCSCQLRPKAQDLLWKDAKLGSNRYGYLFLLHLFTITWDAIGKDSEAGEHRSYKLETRLPLKKEVTELWWFATEQEAKDRAQKAADSWLILATKEVS
jgi:hypothetical protein